MRWETSVRRPFYIMLPLNTGGNGIKIIRMCARNKDVLFVQLQMRRIKHL